MNYILRAALSPATKRLFQATLKDAAITLGLGSDSNLNNPIHETQLVRYIAKLYLDGLAYSSILSRISAINFIHRAHGWTPPSVSFLVSKALAGVRNLRGSSISTRAPVTPDILARLIHALDGFHLSPRERALYRAMFLLAFYAFLRVGEMCALKHTLPFANARLCQRFVALTFTSYKFSTPRAPSIFIPTRPPPLCPVRALHEFFSLRGSAPGPLFSDDNGLPLSSRLFGAILRDACMQADLSDCRITPHSFRIGAATAAAAIGIPKETIQRMGRWTSRAFIRYIKYQINRFH